ncbi:MAG: peptidylprolyl isomerase [Candidatus Krumholzibacteria bacterium]|nr:peptidylprolyl isomerase [Candidatus Krumholzibacteria bacterium]
MVLGSNASSMAVRRAFAWGAVFSLVVFFCMLVPASARPQTDTAAAAAAAVEKTAVDVLPRMVITTEKYGDIVIELYPKEAPKAVERIMGLVRSGFYDGLWFHRVESYVIQTGAIDSELPKIEGEMFSQKLTHEEGMVGMARLPDDYDSAKTQFYICKQHLPLMNNEYTLFGKVIQGIDIVKKIKKGDKIKTITIAS